MGGGGFYELHVFPEEKNFPMWVGGSGRGARAAIPPPPPPPPGNGELWRISSGGTPKIKKCATHRRALLQAGGALDGAQRVGQQVP